MSKVGVVQRQASTPSTDSAAAAPSSAGLSAPGPAPSVANLERAGRRGHRWDQIPVHAPPAPGSAGRPLPAPLQTKMEASFRHDFAPVRVHQDGNAAALGATAYTRGHDIHFAPGRYQPATASGRALIGHELTHVVQQHAGHVAAPQGKGAPINADPALEAEADAQGARAARGDPATVRGVGGGVQRKAATGGGGVIQCQGLDWQNSLRQYGPPPAKPWVPPGPSGATSFNVHSASAPAEQPKKAKAKDVNAMFNVPQGPSGPSVVGNGQFSQSAQAQFKQAFLAQRTQTVAVPGTPTSSPRATSPAPSVVKDPLSDD